jgi:RNA polymerase sigma factor (sigma-70 family)
MGFVRTIVRRQVAAHIGEVIQSRRGEWGADGTAIRDQHTTPEQDLMEDEEVELMKRILGGMSARDREILERFYLREESQETICSEMGLSVTQFRLLKSRAKQRFGELGRRRLESRPQPPPKKRNIFSRTFDCFRH